MEQMGKRGELESAPVKAKELEHELSLLQQAAKQLLNGTPESRPQSRSQGMKTATGVA